MMGINYSDLADGSSAVSSDYLFIEFCLVQRIIGHIKRWGSTINKGPSIPLIFEDRSQTFMLENYDSILF
jgi:hypothetical protein